MTDRGVAVHEEVVLDEILAEFAIEQARSSATRHHRPAAGAKSIASAS